MGWILNCITVKWMSDLVKIHYLDWRDLAYTFWIKGSKDRIKCLEN